MLVLEGIPVSPGFASGIATVYDYEIERRLEVPHRSIEDSEVASECERLAGALDRASGELEEVCGRSSLTFGNHHDQVGEVGHTRASLATERAHITSHSMPESFIHTRKQRDGANTI